MNADTSHSRRLASIFALVSCLGLFAPQVAGAQDTIPAALSPTVIASQVKSSVAITQVPKNLSTPLSKMATDRIDRYYPTLKIGCYNYNAACTFGSTKAKKSLVLLGDSHAGMWAPAIIPAATAAGYRVVVLWYPNCPAADVTPFNVLRSALDNNCVAWHKRIFTDIAAARPSVVILSEATSFAESAAGTPFTPDDWQAGLERTIAAVGGPTTKVIMLSDIPIFAESPSNCLARNLTNVQRCATPIVSTDPSLRQLTSAESAAAIATKVGFISLTSLLCAAVCSPIVGTHVVYADSNHVAGSYAAAIRTSLFAKVTAALASLH
jgi:hypothetical protein